MELTWEEWVQMGEQFKKANEFLVKETVNTTPKSGPKARKLRRAMNGLDAIRSTLDDLVCAAFFRDKGDAVGHLFYGSQHPSEFLKEGEK
jgi:hypothetical protein